MCMQEVYDLIDAHLAARRAERVLAGRLEERAAQFRGVQKRLLLRFRVRGYGMGQHTHPCTCWGLAGVERPCDCVFVRVCNTCVAVGRQQQRKQGKLALTRPPGMHTRGQPAPSPATALSAGRTSDAAAALRPHVRAGQDACAAGRAGHAHV